MAGTATLLHSDFTYGYVDGKRMKLYALEYAMKYWGISRPTFYDWKRKKKIKVWERPNDIIGGPIMRFVTEDELERVKKLMKAGWGRAKGKKGAA